MHRRPKRPDFVCRKIIEQAIDLIGERGLSALTLEAAGIKANVTKGGVMHHFKNRQELIDAVCIYSLVVIAININNFRKQEDGKAYGRFTRSYLKSLSTGEDAVEMVWKVLFHLIAVDQKSQMRWRRWLNVQLARSESTDSAVYLHLLRLAGDALWMAKTTDTLLDGGICFDELIERTHQGTGARLRGS